MRLVLYIILLLVSFSGSAQTPVANFTATTVQGCAPLVVQFNNTSSGTGSGTTWSWNFGNTATSVLQNPSTTYTQPGQYTVTLTATNPGGGSNTKTVTGFITVYPDPVVSWTVNDTDGCPPLAVAFTSTSTLNAPGAGTYLWSFGNSGTATTPTATQVYTGSGNYTVSLRVTNSNGCISTASRPGQIRVFQKPDADFTYTNAQFCSAGSHSVSFTGSATSGVAPYSYQWNFGDGGTGTGVNPSHTYTGVGPYSVRLIVTDANGCSDTERKADLVTTTIVNAGFSMVPAIGCVGTNVSFVDLTSPASTAVEWNFGPNATPSVSTQSTPTPFFNAAGTFPVTLIATSVNGCKDTVTQNVQIAPLPTASFTSSPQIPCSAPATISYTNTSTGAASYQWRFGNGGTSTLANPTRTFNSIGFYTDTLIVTSVNGCVASTYSPNNVRIYNILTSTRPSVTQGCIPLSVQFSNALTTTTGAPNPGVPYPYPSPVTDWLWDFGGGVTSTAANPSHIFTDTGTFTVRVTVTTANGCVIRDSVTIRAGRPPVASFTYAPPTACVKQQISFTNTSTGANSYEWTFGDGGSSGAVSPIYDYTTPGSFQVLLKSFHNGCLDTQRSAPIVINPPNAEFNVVYNCDTPLKIRLQSLSTGAQTYFWDFGDGTYASTANPSHTYAAFGTYSVKLLTANATYGCTDSITKTVTLFKGTVGFASNDTAICRGDSITISGSLAGGAAQAWKWSHQTAAGWVDDTTYTNVLGIRFPNEGRWGVKLVITDAHACKDSLTKANYILVARPIARIKVSDSLGCAPLNVAFTDSSRDVTGVSIVTRYWDFGNTQTLTSTLPTATTVYNRGTYNVMLAVIDEVGCVDTIRKANLIRALKPVALFDVADTSICPGTAVTFQNGSQGSNPLTSRWSFGDGDTSLARLPVHVYRSTGTFTVRLITTDSLGCKDTFTRANYISVTKPDAAFTASDTQTVCPPPFVVNFTDASQRATGYRWDFGNTFSSTLPNASTSYTSPGIYTATLIASDIQGCTDTASQIIRVLGYAGGFTATTTKGCAPFPVTFTTAISGVQQLTWDFADGVTQPASGSSVTHVYQTPGAYIPKLIISNGQGCATSSTSLDTIKIDAITADFTVQSACSGAPVQFTDASRSLFSGTGQQQWLFPGNVVRATVNPQYTLGPSGTYSVQLIATNTTGCKDTVVKSVQVNSLPAINAGRDTMVCPGDAVRLQATGGIRYEWSPSGGLDNPLSATPNASPSTPTEYWVSGTDTNGCRNTDAVVVRLKTRTTGFAGIDTAVCAETLLYLRAGGGTRYLWTPADNLSNDTIPNPVIHPDTTTRYRVIIRQGSCLPDTQYTRVEVYPLPVIDAGSSVRIISGTSTTLVAQSAQANRFQWTPAEGLSCVDCPTPSATPLRTITYTVTGISDKGCEGRDSVTVYLDCNESQLFVPNTFTPNDDGENDVFYPHGNGLSRIRSFRIYNRWGEVVFEKQNIAINDKSAGWDGTQKGEKLPADAFVYSIEAECATGQTLQYKGDVTLIR